MNSTPIRDLVQKTHQIDPEKLSRDSFVYVDFTSVDKDTKTIVAPQTLLVGDAPSRARKEIKTNDVLVATVRPNLNGVAIVPQSYDNEIASTGFCVLRADETKLDPHYLFYFTQTIHFVDHLTKLSIGAGYPAVSDEDILDTEIPLPSLPEQRRIADLLSRADRLRRLRRVGDELSDSLLQSAFVDIFGDPFKHYHEKWKSVPFEEITTRITYGFTNPMSHLLSGIPIITAKNVLDGQIDFENVDYADQKEYDALTLKNKPNKGDILITKDGTIGRCAIIDVDFPICINQSVALVQLNSRVIAKYVFGYLYSAPVREFLESMKKGVALQHLQITEFAQIPIPVPPLPEQEQFAAIVRRIESLRARAGESARQGEELFQSLLALSFSEGLSKAFGQ